MALAPVTPRLLRPPVRWWGYALTIVAGVLVSLGWSFGAFELLVASGSDISPVRDADFFRSWRDLAVIWPAVGIEELIFRAPLALPVALELDRLIAPMMAALSILFGLSNANGFPYVIIQVGVGLILSFVFLKCGGLYQHAIRGWSCATATHGLHVSALWLVGSFALSAGS
jgi:hypothetical protein